MSSQQKFVIPDNIKCYLTSKNPFRSNFTRLAKIIKGLETVEEGKHEKELFFWKGVYDLFIERGHWLPISNFIKDYSSDIYLCFTSDSKIILTKKPLERCISYLSMDKSEDILFIAYKGGDQQWKDYKCFSVKINDWFDFEKEFNFIELENFSSEQNNLSELELIEQTLKQELNIRD